MDDKAIYPLPELSNCILFSTPYFMWFKIMTPQFQAWIGQTHSTSQTRVSESSDYPKMKRDTLTICIDVIR